MIQIHVQRTFYPVATHGHCLLVLIVVAHATSKLHRKKTVMLFCRYAKTDIVRSHINISMCYSVNQNDVAHLHNLYVIFNRPHFSLATFMVVAPSAMCNAPTNPHNK